MEETNVQNPFVSSEDERPIGRAHLMGLSSSLEANGYLEVMRA